MNEPRISYVAGSSPGDPADIDSDPLVVVVEPDPEPIWTFAYVSRPTTLFTDADLKRLHLAAQRFNAHNDLSGRLVVVEREGKVV